MTAALTMTGAVVATQESTTSATFTDLTTVGPAVTVTVPAAGNALVLISWEMINTGAHDEGSMSFALSGANTASANDNQSANCNSGGVFGGGSGTFSAFFYLTGLIAGSTTFTAKYRSTINPLATQIANRNIVVFA